MKHRLLSFTAIFFLLPGLHYTAAGQAGGIRTIAYASDSMGNYDIYLWKIDSNTVTRLTSSLSDDREPALSPDGRWVAFSSNRSGVSEIYRIRTDSSELNGGTVYQVTNSGIAARWPDWSPKNWSPSVDQSICYTKNNEIYYKNADGAGSETQLTGNGQNDRPVWDASGNYILYPHGQWSTTYGKYIYNLHSHNLTNGQSASVTTYFSSYEDVIHAAGSPAGDISYILMNTFSAPTRYEIWDLFGINPANWLRNMADLAFNENGDTIYFTAEDVSLIHQVYRRAANGSGSIVKITGSGYNNIEMDYGLVPPDHQIAEIFPQPYTTIKTNKPGIAFSLFGDGYIWNTLSLFWMQSETHTLSTGLSYTSSGATEHRVQFDPAYAYTLAFKGDTIWVSAQVQALDDTALITVDSAWWYIYNDTPTPLDSIMNSTKQYARKMMDLYLTAQDGKARLQIANNTVDAASLVQTGLTGGFSSNDMVLSTVEYTIWNAPLDSTGVNTKTVAGKVTGVPLGVTDVLFAGLDYALDKTSQYTLTRAQALYSDPPDTNFTSIPSWLGDTDTTAYPHADDSVAIYQYLAARRMSLNAELMRLLTSSYEKYQGAVQATDDFHALMQCKGMKSLSDQLISNMTLLSRHLQWMADTVRGSSYDRFLDISYLDSLKQRVQSDGLYYPEVNDLLNAGLTQAQVLEVRDSILSMNIAGLQDQWLSDVYDSMKVNFAEGVPVFGALSARVQAVMDSLVLSVMVPDSFPTADAGTGYSHLLGGSVQLAGSGSDPNGLALSYAWDLDGDGGFDDASASTPFFSGNDKGAHLAGLQVQNTAGHSAYDYTWVMTDIADSMPAINDFQPDSGFIIIDSSAAIQFSVYAEDPESWKTAGLSYQWLTDNVPSGADTFLSVSFAAADSGLHQVKVILSDTNASSYDTELEWWIRVGPYKMITAVPAYPAVQEGGLSLSGPYPMPFGEEVFFEVLPDRPSRLELTVTDLFGKEIYRRAVRCPAGRQVISWDGKNNSGRGVGKGMYFYSVSDGRSKASGKIIKN